MAVRGPKPKIIDTTWTPELAYVVGVIASDGNLGKDGMYIDVTSKDRVILENILMILNMKHIKIGIKKSGSGNSAFRIQFKRVLFHRWLCSIGLTAQKSKTIRGLLLPDHLFFDFLRGAWDGDGTVYCSKDERWKNSLIVSLGFSSGSQMYLKWLQEEINRRLSTTGHISHGKKVSQLRYARADSRTVFDAMFYAMELPHLPRKFAKAQNIFTITGL